MMSIDVSLAEQVQKTRSHSNSTHKLPKINGSRLSDSPIHSYIEPLWRESGLIEDQFFRDYLEDVREKVRVKSLSNTKSVTLSHRKPDP